MKILLIKNRAMGDCIMGLGALRCLKETFPSAEIDYAIPNWISPLLEGEVPQAHSVRGIETHTLRGWFNLLRLLISRRYDFTLELHQSGRTRLFFQLFGWLVPGKYFFHNHNFRIDRKNSHPVLGQGVLKPSIQRDLDLVTTFCRSLDKKISPHFLKFTPRIKTQTQALPEVICFGVSAGHASKCWPLAYFHQLAAQLKHLSPRLRILIPLSQSSFDQNLKQEIEKFHFPHWEVIQSPLRDLLSKIGQCGVYIGNDTGLKHLAVAMGMKTLTIFGNEDPLEWHPYSGDLHPFFFIDPLPQGSLENRFPYLKSRNSEEILNSITSDMVFQKIKTLGWIA